MARSRLASVTLRPSGFQSLFFGVGGAAQRMLERKAQQVAVLARANASSNGTISEGIVVGPVVGKSVKVVSTNPHSLLVHNGSPAHRIAPRRRGGYLRFEVGGRIVYARMVNHPGYRGNPFLTDALKQAR